MTAHLRAMKTDSDKAILQKNTCTLHHPGFKLKSEKSPEKAERARAEGTSLLHKESVPVSSVTLSNYFTSRPVRAPFLNASLAF